jgi:DNA-binding NarL/FixJ family response regulator
VTKDAPAAPAAHAVALRKTYGTGQAAVHALAGITVAFDRGRFTAVMGPSGSGKSTLMLTTYDTDSHVLPAIEAGATGYLLKDAPRAELLRAVRAAARGEAVLSPSVAARLMSRFRAPGTGPLSQRELEVLELVAAGTTNREAAARLFITEATVKTHLLNIYAKLGVGDRAAAVAEAFNRGLLTPGTSERPW